MRKLFDYIYDRIKEMNFEDNELCRQYWLKLERLKKDFTDEAGIAMLFENIEWLVNSGVITGQILQSFAKNEKFEDHGIYFTGEVTAKDCNIILFGNTVAEVSGHSRVRMFDNSICTAEDSSFISAYHQAKVSAKNCKIIAFDEAEVKSRGFCLIERYDESVSVEAGGKDLVY